MEFNWQLWMMVWYHSLSKNQDKKFDDINQKKKEFAHPDLTPNYVAADSYDFCDNDVDPSPGADFFSFEYSKESHFC